MSRIGTCAWLRSGRGVLTGADQLRLAGQAVRAQGEILASLIHRLGGLPASAWEADRVTALQAPDTAAAKAAYAEIVTVASPALLNHSLRCYLWGRLLAAQEALALDDEAYYIASLYHDFGLTDAAQDAPCQCFTLTSADAALAFAARETLSPDRAACIAEAIAMHINVGVFSEERPEAYLLHHATTMDCTGLRLWEFTPGARAAVLARHPRYGFTQEVALAFQREMTRCPHTRMRFLYRYALFGTLMRFGPLKGD